MVVFYYLVILILLRSDRNSPEVRNEHPVPDCRLVNHFPGVNWANLSIASQDQSYYQPFHNARNIVDADANDNESIQFSLKMFSAPSK